MAPKALEPQGALSPPPGKEHRRAPEEATSHHNAGADSAMDPETQGHTSPQQMSYKTREPWPRQAATASRPGTEGRAWGAWPAHSAEIILRSRGPGRVSWLFFNISGGRKEKTEVGEVPRGLLLLSDCPAIQAWRAPVAPGLGRCSHQACQGAKHPSMDIPRSLLEARQALKRTTNIV
ncbi:hypothetical protein CHARACLAT_015911, partial [Characodon lateralis]|nr:hypothetical protein [Characodon lateralis]